MRDGEFEWDDGKAKRNFRDHRVTFEVARSAFDDPGSIDREDPDPDEERFSRLCRLDHRVFVVVWNYTRQTRPHHIGQIGEQA